MPSPSDCQCPGEAGGMTVLVAVVVGAAATLLATGVATIIGLVEGMYRLQLVALCW
jgi:hypothetical protein